MVEEIDLGEGGWLLHASALFPAETADTLFVKLQSDVPWRQEVLYGHPAPRLNAWYSDEGLAYAYSGLTHRGVGWPPWLLPVKAQVEAAAKADFNSLLLNRYRNGQDSIGFHSDAEPELGLNPVVATLSFGATREFVLRHRKLKEKRVFRLTHGSLLVMGGTSQHQWLHGVPKTTEQSGERISLTYRRILGPHNR